MENYSMYGKLLQVLKKGQASYVRKYPKTRMILTIFESGSETLGHEKVEKVMKKSWNLKSSTEYEPCYIFRTDKGKSVLSYIANATAGVDGVLGATIFEGFVFFTFRLCLTILPLFFQL